MKARDEPDLHSFEGDAPVTPIFLVPNTYPVATGLKPLGGITGNENGGLI